MRIVVIERWESGKRESVFQACAAGVFSTALLTGRRSSRSRSVCVGSGEHGPADTGDFVRETDGHDVRVRTGFKSLNPIAEAGIAAPTVKDYGASAMYQQSAQVWVTSLADAQ